MKIIIHSLLLLTILGSFSSCASRKNPAKAEYHMKMGLDQFKRRNLRSALRELRLAKQNDPNNLDILNSLGLVLHQLGDIEEALTVYKKALEEKEDSPETNNNIGVLYLDIKQYERAIYHFKVALKDPFYKTPGLAYANMGFAFYKKGAKMEGITIIKKAVFDQPGLCVGYKMLTDIYLIEKNYNLLAEYSGTYAKFCDRLVDAQYKAGLATLRTKKDPYEAKPYFKKCVEISGLSQFESDTGKACRQHLKQLNR